MKVIPACFLGLVWLLAGCGSSDSKQNGSATDSVARTVPATPKSAPDSLTLDLAKLKTAGAFAHPQTIRVADDPVFHTPKTYRALPLRALLDKYTTLNKLNPAQTQLVFECEDGYNPSMPLTMVLSKKAFLAVGDADAPAGQDWLSAKKNGEVKKVAPFYVVYTDVPAAAHDFKWPYNLVRISLVSTAKEYAAVYPHNDNTMVRGFGLFQRNCGICHALNGVGGQMGPELNYPKSVTEYWRSTSDIKAFVKNPQAYRHASKMPAVTYLSDRELDEIMRYLQYMAKHKLTGPVS